MDSPRFVSGSTLQLGKATIIESNRSIGKTAFYEWIAAATGRVMPERWRTNKVRLDIRYTSPLPHRLEFEIEGDNRQYLIDGLLIHTPPPDFQIVHMPEELLRGLVRDDLELISSMLSVGADVARGLAVEARRNGSRYLSALEFVEQQPDEGEKEGGERKPLFELRVTRASTGIGQSFASLSTSEKFLTLLEFAAALARERARTAPTLLLLDAGGWNLGEGSWQGPADFLLKQPFQTALTPNIFQFSEPVWQSWNRIKFRRADVNDPESLAVID